MMRLVSPVTPGSRRARSHPLAIARSQHGAAWVKVLVVLVFASGIAAFFAFDGPRYLSLDTIKANRDQLLALTAEHYLLAILIAFAVYVAATALSLPGGVLLSLTVGMLFGRWVGSAIIVAAATVGATGAFLAARYLFADFARRRLSGSDGLAARITQGFSDNAFNYLLFLRLVPLFPFWLVNLAPAFAAIKVRTFVAATAIGILPGVFVFANLGQSLGRIESTAELLSPGTLGAFALLGLFALVPIAIKKLRARRGLGSPAATPYTANRPDTPLS